jgi:hypothetical protein
MEENKILTLRQPGEVADPLTEVLRNGARALLAQAVEAEVAEALAAHAHLTTDDGHPPGSSRPYAGADYSDRHRAGDGSRARGTLISTAPKVPISDRER